MNRRIMLNFTKEELIFIMEFYDAYIEMNRHLLKSGYQPACIEEFVLNDLRVMLEDFEKLTPNKKELAVGKKILKKIEKLWA